MEQTRMKMAALYQIPFSTSTNGQFNLPVMSGHKTAAGVSEERHIRILSGIRQLQFADGGVQGKAAILASALLQVKCKSYACLLENKTT